MKFHSFAQWALSPVLLLALSLPAAAATYTFSYQFDSGNSISGTLEGELQGDGDTVLASSGQAQYDGAFYAGLAPLPVLLFPNDPGGVASFSGLGVSLSADACLFDLISVSCVGDASYTIGGIGNNVYVGGVVNIGGLFPTFVSESEAFEATNWSLTGPSNVPLPAAAWLFGSALMGLLGIGRVRRTKGA